MRVLALLSVLLLVAVSVAQETNELEDMDDLALSVEEDDSDGMDAELDKIDAEVRLIGQALQCERVCLERSRGAAAPTPAVWCGCGVVWCAVVRACVCVCVCVCACCACCVCVWRRPR